MHRVGLSGRFALAARSVLSTESRMMLRTNALPAMSLGTLPMVMSWRDTGRDATNALLRPDWMLRRHFSAASSDESKQSTVDAPAKGKIKVLWENYGMVFLGFYGGLYLVTLGSVYEIVALKHIDAEGAVATMHSIGLDKFVDLTPIATSKAGNFALAWILTKFTEPLRLAFTVSITPTLSRFLGYAPPKPPKQPRGGSAVDVNAEAPSSTRVPEVHHAKPKE